MREKFTRRAFVGAAGAAGVAASVAAVTAKATGVALTQEKDIGALADARARQLRKVLQAPRVPRPPQHLMRPTHPSCSTPRRSTRRITTIAVPIWS